MILKLKITQIAAFGFIDFQYNQSIGIDVYWLLVIVLSIDYGNIY